VEVVHGRLPSLEVQAAVERFRASEAEILLGTTVVEVGLDVPNIQHMAILQAGKLGWASLHQLRGRLARGPQAPRAECVLFCEENSLERLQKLESCADGFQVAALDLHERGPGSLRGEHQHGKGDFQVFNPLEDVDLVDALRRPVVREWLLGEG